MTESRPSTNTPPTHRLIIYLPEHTTITMDTSEPETLMKTISDGMYEYYKPRWWKKRKVTVRLIGKHDVIIPIDKIICCKIEELPVGRTA